jgi:hypothetical protein
LKVYFPSTTAVGVALNGTLLAVCNSNDTVFGFGGSACIAIFGTRTITGDVYFDDFNLYDQYSAVPGKTACEQLPLFRYPILYPSYTGTIVNCTIAGAVDVAGALYSALNGTYALTYDAFTTTWRISGLAIVLGTAGVCTVIRMNDVGLSQRGNQVAVTADATLGSAAWLKTYDDTTNTTQVGDNARTLTTTNPHGGTAAVSF